MIWWLKKMVAGFLWWELTFTEQGYKQSVEDGWKLIGKYNLDQLISTRSYLRAKCGEMPGETLQ